MYMLYSAQYFNELRWNWTQTVIFVSFCLEVNGSQSPAAGRVKIHAYGVIH